MKRFLAPAFVLAACVWVGGCATASSVVVRSTGGVRGPTGYEVEVDSPELRDIIKVVRSVDRTETGERVAQIDVQNLTQKPVHLEYQIRWRDQYGSELVTLWEWRHYTLDPGKTHRIEDEVIDSEWVHYIWEFRLDKRKQ
jgi:uncharacterized protein YcfL